MAFVLIAGFGRACVRCFPFRYMAPEVLMDAKYGCKCDVYSFGVLLCELLNPQCFVNGYFDVERESETKRKRFIDRVQNGLRPELPDSDDVPKSLLRLLSSCFHQEHDRRPSMDAVLSELRNIRKQLLRTTEPISVAELVARPVGAGPVKKGKRKMVAEGNEKELRQKDKELRQKEQEIKKLKAQLLALQKVAGAGAAKDKPSKNSKDGKHVRHLERVGSAARRHEGRPPKRFKRAAAENTRPTRRQGMLQMLSNPLKDITNYEGWMLF